MSDNKSLLPPTLLIPKLTRTKVQRWVRLKDLNEEVSKLKARIKALDKERDDLQAELIASFDEADVEQMRLNARTILTRKEITVDPATIERKGYSYSLWEEVAG